MMDRPALPRLFNCKLSCPAFCACLKVSFWIRYVEWRREIKGRVAAGCLRMSFFFFFYLATLRREGCAHRIAPPTISISERNCLPPESSGYVEERNVFDSRLYFLLALLLLSLMSCWWGVALLWIETDGSSAVHSFRDDNAPSLFLPVQGCTVPARFHRSFLGWLDRTLGNLFPS